jgi:hypothetical protein
MKRFVLSALLIALVPGSSSATQVHARYDVDATQLKAAVAGTALTFSFYSDSACTSLLDSEVVDVEDVDTIEVLKRFTPKNAAKAPKTARIWQTVSLTPSRWRYFLTVTGTGVTPVGGVCQEQLASPPAAVASSAPAGVIPVGAGFTPLSSLPVAVPADGTLDVVFETVISAGSVDNYIICSMTIDGGGGGTFLLDPGDLDTPIPNYDIAQTHHRTFAVAAGAHTLDVSCNQNAGADSFTFGSQIVARFFAAGM